MAKQGRFPAILSNPVSPTVLTASIIYPIGLSAYTVLPCVCSVVHKNDTFQYFYQHHFTVTLLTLIIVIFFIVHFQTFFKSSIQNKFLSQVISNSTSLQRFSMASLYAVSHSLSVGSLFAGSWKCN